MLHTSKGRLHMKKTVETITANLAKFNSRLLLVMLILLQLDNCMAALALLILTAAWHILIVENIITIMLAEYPSMLITMIILEATLNEFQSNKQ